MSLLIFCLGLLLAAVIGEYISSNHRKLMSPEYRWQLKEEDLPDEPKITICPHCGIYIDEG